MAFLDKSFLDVLVLAEHTRSVVTDIDVFFRILADIRFILI